MAEQIKIFELKIDVDAAIKSQSDLKKENDLVKKSLDKLKKSGDTTSESYVRLEATSKNLNKEYNASQTQLGKLLNLQGKQIKTVEQGRNAITILNKEWAKTASLYGDNSKQAEILAQKHKEVKDRVNELQKGVGDSSANIGRYSEGMTEAIGKTTLFGKVQSGVANVMGVITPIYRYVRTEITGIRNDYLQASTATIGFSIAQKAVAIGTNLVSSALKLFRVALIATGIGAIIVLVGSLVAYFSSFQSAIDKVNQVMSGLTAAAGKLFSSFAKIGGIIASVIGGQKSLSEAWKEGKEVVAGLGDSIVDTYNKAKDIEKLIQQTRKLSIEVSKNIATLQLRSEKFKAISDDATRSFKEREDALKKSVKIEQEIANQTLQIANQELSNLQAKNKLKTELTDEEKKKEAELFVALKTAQKDIQAIRLQNLKEERMLKQDRLEKDLDILIDGFDNVKTINDRIIDSDKTTLLEKARLIKENTKLSDDSFVNQISTLQKLTSETINTNDLLKESNATLLNEKIRALGLSEIGETRLLEVIRERRLVESELSLQVKELAEKTSLLSVKNAEKELETFKDVNKSKIEQGVFLSDTLVAQELNRLKLVRDQELVFQSKRLEEGVINQKKYNDAIAKVDSEYKESKNKITLEQKEQELEADAIDFENQQTLRVERDGLVFEAKLLKLEKNKKAEIKDAEKVGADTTLIEEKYKNQKEEIKQIEKDSKLNIQKELFGGVAELLGKETAAGKAAGIASATINAYQGVSEVWRAKSILAEPFGTAAKVVSTGTVLASGLKAVQSIKATKSSVPKAEKGITLSGSRHSGGGINLFDGGGNNILNAEDGENMYVINRRASALINGLSTINELTGGVPLSNSTNFAMDGGMVQRSITANQSSSPVVFKSEAINYDLMASKIGEANKLLPPPITDINDVIRVANNVNTVVDGANI